MQTECITMKTEGEDTRDSGGEGMQPFLKPKFEEIARLISNDGPIHNGEVTSQRSAASNAKLYGQIEKDFHGNKAAAMAVRRLVKLDQAHRDDFLRTFEGLCDFLELWPARDLVDQAEGKGKQILSGGDHGRPVAVVQKAGVDYTPDNAPNDNDDDDDDEQGDAVGKVDAAPAASPFKSALDGARGHLGGKSGDPEPKAPPKPRGRKAPGTPAVH